MKCFLASLGCAKNQVDAEVMLGFLQQAGYTVTDKAEEAEVIIVNTCGFIDPAKEESIETILSLARQKETGQCLALIVTGCLVQRYQSELQEEIPEIDAFAGTGDFPSIVSIAEEALSGKKPVQVTDKPDFIYDAGDPRSHVPGKSVYVKIAEGCDNCCSYCVIPAVRGPFRSRSLESVCAEVESLLAKGYSEIILIAQDTTRYGEDLYGRLMLPELLGRLSALEGDFWLRLLYCYPTRFTDELLDVIAKEDKICNYIEMPLQHSSDRILRAMNRQGSREDILALLQKIRRKVPDVTLRTSFIVGFPGETEEDFADLLDFLTEVKFDRVGIFLYSQEDGTKAGAMPEQTEQEVKQERYDIAMRLQQKISLAKNQEWVGRELTVLLESISEDAEFIVARSYRDAPEIDGVIYVQPKSGLALGTFVQVMITEALEYDLIGEVVG